VVLVVVAAVVVAVVVAAAARVSADILRRRRRRWLHIRRVRVRARDCTRRRRIRRHGVWGGTLRDLPLRAQKGMGWNRWTWWRLPGKAQEEEEEEEEEEVVVVVVQ
jgi:hypothetical protein